jgi:hypothetical protein
VQKVAEVAVGVGLDLLHRLQAIVALVPEDQVWLLLRLAVTSRGRGLARRLLRLCDPPLPPASEPAGVAGLSSVFSS